MLKLLEHTTVDVATAILLPVVAFFVNRLIKRQDRHGDRLDNHAQRLSSLDGKTDD